MLNHICNGPSCDQYREFVARLAPEDQVITLNWDTLLDRVLWETGAWWPDDGYGIKFRSVMDGVWRAIDPTRRSSRRLLKLHGSTNWLTNYMSHEISTGRKLIAVPRVDDDNVALRIGLKSDDGKTYYPRVEAQQWHAVPIDDSPSDERVPCCFVRSDGAYRTYDDRYLPGFLPFTYYFPPNTPVGDIPTLPLLIPPTKAKPYGDFETVVGGVWDQAEKELKRAQELVVIGYSFPETDSRVADLVARGLWPGGSLERIVLVDPEPDGPASRLNRALRSTRRTIECPGVDFDGYLASW